MRTQETKMKNAEESIRNKGKRQKKEQGLGGQQIIQLGKEKELSFFVFFLSEEKLYERYRI